MNDQSKISILIPKKKSDKKKLKFMEFVLNKRIEILQEV